MCKKITLKWSCRIWISRKANYRVFRSRMSFSRWFKITEKLNLHYKTRLLYYQDLPPFHFIAINPKKIVQQVLKLDQFGITRFCWKIWPSLIWNFSDSVFYLHYGPQSPYMPFILLGAVEILNKNLELEFFKKIIIT